MAHRTETFEDIVFSCNAHQYLMALEVFLLSSIRYESELRKHTVVHSDISIRPNNDAESLAIRGEEIGQHGVRPAND